MTTVGSAGTFGRPGNLGTARSTAQRSERLGRLALHGVWRAAECLSRLIDVQVAVEAEDEDGPLPWRQPAVRGPQVE